MYYLVSCCCWEQFSRMKRDGGEGVGGVGGIESARGRGDEECMIFFFSFKRVKVARRSRCRAREKEKKQAKNERKSFDIFM